MNGSVSTCLDYHRGPGLIPRVCWLFALLQPRFFSVTKKQHLI